MRTRWRPFIPIEDPDGIYCPIRTTMAGDCSKILKEITKPDKKHGNIVKFHDITDHFLTRYSPEIQFAVVQRYTTNEKQVGMLLQKINDPVYNMVMLYDNRIYVGYIQPVSTTFGFDIKFQKALVYRDWKRSMDAWDAYIGTKITMITEEIKNRQ